MSSGAQPQTSIRAWFSRSTAARLAASSLG